MHLDLSPVPDIDDLLDRLAYAAIFTKIDFTSAYHQILIADGHQYKKAIQTNFRLYSG